MAPKKQLDRSQAWVCLTTNLFILPGIGSILGGRKTGWFQAIFSLSGLFLSAGWVWLFIQTWLKTGEYPMNNYPDLRLGIEGILLFGTGWVWALFTSIGILKNTVKT